MSAFKVSIVAGKDKALSSISVSGKVRYPSSELDKDTFQLDYPDKTLREAIGKYFGRIPDDHVHFNSTYSKKNLFSKHGWQEAQTIIEAVDAEILEVTTEDTARYDVVTSSFNNQTSNDGNFVVSAHCSGCNSLSTSWAEKRLVSVNDAIKYEVKFFNADECSLSCEQGWVESRKDIENTRLCSVSEVKYTVAPNTSVFARLDAKWIVLKARVRYRAHLTGMMGLYYSPKYKGEHWWGLPIKDVQSSCDDLPESVEITEDIEVEYLAKHKVTVFDKKTNEKLLTHVF